MGLTRIVFVILATWSSLDILTGANIKLSSTTSVIEYGRRYTLQCTVTGNLRSREMSFNRNTVEICKRHVSKITGTTSCETFYNTSSSYQCLCVGYYSDVSVYRITINSFKEVDATGWWCSAKVSDSNETNRLSKYVYLFYVTLSGNVTKFDANGVNSITFTCETSNTTGSVTFEWINKTTEGSTYIKNNLTVSKHGSTYRQDLKLIPHWYQHENKIACKVFNVSSNITAMSNSEVLDLIYPPVTSPVMKQVTNPETPLSSEITVHEGAMLNLSCEVTGGKPSVSNVTIQCDGTNPSTFYTVVGDRVTGHLSLTVWRNFHKHTCQCSAKHKTGRYHLTSNVTIRINYLTVRHEFKSTNKTVTVICDAVEHQDNYSFSPFTHFWGEYRIRELPGQREETNRYVLTIHNVTYADSGKYLCGVSHRNQTNFTSLEIGGKPILDNDSKQNQIVYVVLGKTVVFKRKIFSNSNITLHMWINQLDQNVTGRLSRTNVTLDIYSIVVKDAGYLLTLKISNISKGDLGLYTLHVCNNDGCGDFYTTLKVAISEPIMSPDPILIPAASGAAGFVILLAVVVVIICVIKKKRRNSQTNKNNNDSEHDSVNQTDKQGEETVMEDNELYFMPSNRKNHKNKPVMEDNELYFSSKKHKEKQATDDALGPDEQGVDVKPEDASAMYSVINKHRNRASDDNTEPTGNDINSVSSVANGEDKQPGDEDFSSLYSTVNKHPKTVADDNTKPADEDTNALYSVVNKKSKTKANDSTTHPGEEEEREINDLYSVVNKKSKTERDDNTDPTA